MHILDISWNLVFLLLLLLFFCFFVLFNIAFPNPCPHESLPPHPMLCIFRRYLLSHTTLVLFDDCALQSEHHRIFCHDSSSKRVYVPFKDIKEFETWISIVFNRCSLHDVHSSECEDSNPWMNVPKWSKLQRICPAQGVGLGLGTAGLTLVTHSHIFI